MHMYPNLYYICDVCTLLYHSHTMLLQYHESVRSEHYDYACVV